ncbi:MAG: HlyU family transcriptional regulator [Yoonia sp.]|uniref:HlyU family transcriptional regulator n=1 Tax=Yoonia sp. TaxID=2212373 RepID=UPI00273DCE36|nr:HlyU family transcriptional regulator [Yoonia sp.]MDP5084350.1 HlyU family transcriptional regulator [Yoonia sp.]
MALFSKLFGGGKTPEASPPETYKDFAIFAVPLKESDGWRISARIEKDGQTYTLIRADVIQSKEQADAASIAKAKQMIDEQGDRLFS